MAAAWRQGAPEAASGSRTDRRCSRHRQGAPHAQPTFPPTRGRNSGCEADAPDPGIRHRRPRGPGSRCDRQHCHRERQAIRPVSVDRDVGRWTDAHITAAPRRARGDTRATGSDAGQVGQAGSSGEANPRAARCYATGTSFAYGTGSSTPAPKRGRRCSPPAADACGHYVHARPARRGQGPFRTAAGAWAPAPAAAGIPG